MATAGTTASAPTSTRLARARTREEGVWTSDRNPTASPATGQRHHQQQQQRTEALPGVDTQRHRRSVVSQSVLHERPHDDRDRGHQDAADGDQRAQSQRDEDQPQRDADGRSEQGAA